MPNGFHGPKDDWETLEADLRSIDVRVAAYARQNGMSLSKNYHNWPERSLSWGDSICRLMQIYLEDEKKIAYNFWLCAHEDRDGKRYIKKFFLKRTVPFAEIQKELDILLEIGRQRLESWQSRDLELSA